MKKEDFTPLFPMLSGLFGISTLIVSLNDNNAIPEQKHQQDIQLDRKKALIAVVLGTISSFFTSTFPGLSSSIAATMSLQAYKKLGDHGFLILTGAIGTAGFTLSLVAVLAIQKARNGSIAAISSLMEIGLSEVAIFLAAALVAGGIAVWLTLWIGVKFSSLIGKVNYKRLVISIIVFIILVGFLLSGPLGMVVLATSTAIGLIPAIVKTTRTQAMGCLMAPVILYFL